ncbi:GNAT family N-acetyltransferase [Streptomyces decoyicus]|uniref:GNAT family N-acetyltransferase n=1 Tax=Streptomyces decoyicus TaxID=249567 RepID=UPI0004AACF89|nr:GNAT family N-acetyltransferase [Streptomyces decoyicus]KOG46075.1 acetyltransferase [Streptomyces decoyicus]QZY19338.1 GNAT family N-acetyltransferase [Streptomyces decoyicus]
MALAMAPTIPAGTLSRTSQPSLPSHDGALLLRSWEADDAPVLQRAFQDRMIRRRHVHHVTSLDEAQEWITATHRSWQQEQDAQWAVTRADDGEILGRVALRRMNLVHGLAECAYWVLPNARGAGVAPRAVATVTAWALVEAGFHRLELAHSVGNEASCRVAIKSGFVLEGTLRSARLQQDGRHDTHLHARVRGDA